MIYDIGIAWRNIRNRPVETLVPIFVVALAIALSVSVIVLADGAEEGIVQASDPFGVLVVGAAGSGQDLVLSSILLQGNPIGNIPYQVYDDLANDARVLLAVPLAFGDSVGGARIVGTNRNFFELRANISAPPAFQIREGRLFDDAAAFEAVLGAAAARRLGLGIGDQFLGTHGIGQGIAENVHEDAVYTVVGVLDDSGTAYDTAVYTQLESVWDTHAEEGHEDEDEHDENADEADEAITGLPTIGQTALVQEVGAAPERNQVTSVLVLASGFIEMNQIVQEFYVDPTLQAAFPGEQLNNLLSLLNQGQDILNIVGYLVLGIAGLTVFLSMYSAIIARQQSIAIMRGLGSSRLTVFRVVIFETLIVSLVGALVGRWLGYGIANLIALIFSEQSAIPVLISFLPELELLLWGLALGVGLLAGIIPAWMAYRVNVVEKLFPT
ncbi:MAG: ABC transporter permease [Anaerolineae bacterium]